MCRGIIQIMGTIVSYILIGVLLVGMIVLMFVQGRRQKKAQSDYLAMLDTLRPGVRVKMASGLLGRIKEIREEAPNFKTIVITTNEDKNSTEMTFVIEAVQGIVNEEAINRMNAEKLAAAVNAQEEARSTTSTEPEDTQAPESETKTTTNPEPRAKRPRTAPRSTVSKRK